MPFKVKNNAQKLPKRFQKNFEKSRKRLFRTPKWSKMTPKMVKNVVFWIFSTLLWSCLRSVRALFSTLKGLLLGVFSALKAYKWPRKLRFLVKIWASEMVILAISWAKKVIFWPFSKLFWSCCGSAWALFLYLNGQLLSEFITLNVFKEPESSPLGSGGCPTLQKIRRILIQKAFGFFNFFRFFCIR